MYEILLFSYFDTWILHPPNKTLALLTQLPDLLIAHNIKQHFTAIILVIPLKRVM